MRGTHRHVDDDGFIVRFIPAHAGNTAGPRRPRQRQPVHPRACGEHSRSHAVEVLSCGSSPRMRGTRVIGRARNDSHRFIPAHAGNTPEAGHRASRRSVHPRACGEHFSAPYQPASRYGSSPRMRGTHRKRRRPCRRYRFIPAHAGNTRPSTHRLTVLPVHPRACGEHRSCARTSAGWPGSSPRMRGTRRC